MAVQFILGRSGTGKTSYCINAVIEALLAGGKRSLILLVPEQATYQAERAILADSRIMGYSSRSPLYNEARGKWQPALNVLSFARLQFLLFGKNSELPELSAIGRQMIVHKLLCDNVERLRVFGPTAASVGMGREMAATISELYNYAKTSEGIEQLVKELEKSEAYNLAALKFADIGLVFNEYLKSIEGRFTDPAVQQSRFSEVAKKAEFICGSSLWVDGFAGFTTAEAVILADLLKHAEEARIALCLDPSKLNLANPDPAALERAELFSPTEKTYAELVGIIKKCRLDLAEPVVLKEPVRFRSSAELAHIEQGIFETRASRISAAGDIRIVAAPNARSEVRFVAGQIRRLVRQRGWRFREIAVITSDISGYEHYIKAYFDDYGIPFFIDKPELLSRHPVVELICSALQVVTGGFATSDVFAYLKTDLVGVERKEVDLLENYCLAYGVDGADWQSVEDWSFASRQDNEFDEKLINRIRQIAAGPLLKLAESLTAGDSPARKLAPEAFTRIVFDLLEELGICQRLGEWTEQDVRCLGYRAPDEHRQLFDKLVNLFDELVEVFAGSELTCEDYLTILRSAFSQLTMAFIPPSLDQVLVGSIERSRHPDLKAAFLIGATQGQFPVPVSPSGILTDEDRQSAASAGFAMAPGSTQKLIERQYLAYIAFTRPSKFLCVTYPLVDQKGSPQVRSQFLDEVESLFENLEEEPMKGDESSVAGFCSEPELAEFLCTQLGRDLPADADKEYLAELEMLLEQVCRDPELAEVGHHVKSAINYHNRAELEKSVADELFAGELTGSATRLATFAACPYSYFARYSLQLQERREFKFEPLDLGAFYHRVLDGLQRRVIKEKKDFASAGEDELLALLREQIDELVQGDSFISNFVRRSELCFGDIGRQNDSLGCYTIELSGGRVLSMSGKIDRVDILNAPGKTSAIVLDYKLSPRSFDWAQFFHGLDMQLAIYMLALRRTSDPHYGMLDTAGAFYIPIDVKPKKAELDDLAGRADKFPYKARGLFDGRYAAQLDKNAKGDSDFYNFYITKDGRPYGHYGNRGALKPAHFEKILEFTEDKMARLAEEILAGKIDVKPYRLGTSGACTNCKYKVVCRFDWQINGYNLLDKLSKTSVLERIGIADG